MGSRNVNLDHTVPPRPAAAVIVVLVLATECGPPSCTFDTRLGPGHMVLDIS